MANRITGVLAVILAAIYIYATKQLPVAEISDPLGPKVFPYLIGAGLLLSAVALLAATLRSKETDRAKKFQKESDDTRHYWVVGAVAVWSGLYLAAFDWLGYAISTSIYLLALMAYFHRGKWMANVLTSVLYSFVSYWLFTKFLGVLLPQGILPF